MGNSGCSSCCPTTAKQWLTGPAVPAAARVLRRLPDPQARLYQRCRHLPLPPSSRASSPRGHPCHCHRAQPRAGAAPERKKHFLPQRCPAPLAAQPSCSSHSSPPRNDVYLCRMEWEWQLNGHSCHPCVFGAAHRPDRAQVRPRHTMRPPFSAQKNHWEKRAPATRGPQGAPADPCHGYSPPHSTRTPSGPRCPLPNNRQMR